MSGWFVVGDPVPVEVGECLCPGAPHPEGDTVWLRPALDAEGGLAAVGAMAGEDATNERLGRVYLEHGIVRWTFLDDAGKPVPVDRHLIRDMRWGKAVLALANKAAELYGEMTLDPFQPAPLPASSRNGQTARPTSATRSGSSTRQRR